MPYRNINIPQEYLSFILQHKKIHKTSLQVFVEKAIQEEVAVQKEITEKLEEIKNKRKNAIR